MILTLIYPSVGRKENTPYVRAWQMEPLSMALLASLTPPGIEVRFYDDRLEDIPFDEPTDLVAISVETFTALRAYKIARAFRAMGSKVIYFAGYKDGRDLFKRDEIERYTDQVVWSTDSGAVIEPPGDVPRDPADPALLDLHARLVAELRGLPA